MLPTYEGCLLLLAAVARRWLQDAKTPEELASLAAWLNMTPAQLERRQAGRWAADPHARRCPGCGRALPFHNASQSGAGRRRLFCGDTCRARAAKQKVKS